MPYASCESIGVKENVGVVTEEIKGRPILEELWIKHKYCKILRILSLIKRFIYNCRNKE